MKKSLLAGLGLDELKKPVEPSNKGEVTAGQMPSAGQTPSAGLFIPLENIEPDSDQPRKLSGDEDTAELGMLAESILQHGILQPITVTALGDGRYRIVSGERRWRASKIALESKKPCQRKGYDLKRIPVFIRDPEDDNDKLEMQMVENLARADMSDMDVGVAINRLLVKTGLPKAEIARRLGRSVTWVSTVVAKASPEALEVSARIGADAEKLGSGEAMRLISWSKDAEKQVVLDWIKADLATGRPFSRAVLDDAEDRYEITHRFPKLANREDLSLEDLRTWKGFWDSPDADKQAIAGRVLDGMGLTEALVPVPVDTSGSDDSEEQEETNHGGASDVEASDFEDSDNLPENVAPISELMDAGKFEEEFDIGDAEANDAALAREVLSPAPVSANTPAQTQPVAEKATTEKSITEQARVSMDAAGLEMEAGVGYAPVAGLQDMYVAVRIPADLVKQLLAKTGITETLTVDSDMVLSAIQTMVQNYTVES